MRWNFFKADHAAAAVINLNPVTPPGSLLYAIGDTHGRADLLRRMIALIRADSAEQPFLHRPILVFLGDYIDRGSASNQVVATIIDLQSDPFFEIYALRGNHDQFLLDFLEQPTLGPTWVNYGGAATMLSYGVAPPRHSDEAGWAEAAEKLARAVPQEHITFLKDTKLYATFGDYIFVHAGLRPDIELENQATSDLISIRDPFLGARQPASGRIVVFGHTPFEAPLVEEGKIGIDTGACATGVLTALSLFNGMRRFLQTGAPDRIWAAPEPSHGKKTRPNRL